jgi:hypothetical protein
MLEGIAGSVTGAYQQTLTAKAPQPNRVAARPQELEGAGAGAAKATGETAAGGAAGTEAKGGMALEEAATAAKGGTHYLTPSEFAELPRAGTIDPKVIRYSQDSAGSTFKPPYGSVDDFVQGLHSGKIDPTTIDPIRIFEKDGKIFTLDNRRLYSYKQVDINIPYQKFDAVPKRELFKFTTTNEGTSITIRNGK